jgi:hypothetical protein
MALLQSTMIEGIRNLLANLKKVTLHDGSKVALGIDWAKVVIPREQKGNGELGSGSQVVVAATQQPAESGQLSDTSVVTERGRPREEVEAEEEQPIPPPSTFGFKKSNPSRLRAKERAEERKAQRDRKMPQWNPRIRGSFLSPNVSITIPKSRLKTRNFNLLQTHQTM